MLKAIHSAQHTVNFASYILHSDEVGRQFRDAFCERAAAGIEVRVLLDGIGSGWSLDNSGRPHDEEGRMQIRLLPSHSFVAGGSHESPVASARPRSRWESGVHRLGWIFAQVGGACSG